MHHGGFKTPSSYFSKEGNIVVFIVNQVVNCPVYLTRLFLQNNLQISGIVWVSVGVVSLYSK